MPLHPVRPRDYCRTLDGLALAVLDDRPRDGRLLATLRYLPVGDRDWRKLTPADGLAWLREHRPSLVTHAEHLDAEVAAVPIDDIAEVRRATAFADELLADPVPRDALHGVARRALLLLGAAGVPVERLGVAGSLLLGAARRTSDVDVVIHGRAAFATARDAVTHLLAVGDLAPLDEAAWRRTWERRPCGLSLAEFIRHESRKRTRVLLRGTKLDLVCVPDAHEQPTDHAVWRKHGRGALLGTVIDADGAWDYPARYRIDHRDIAEIVAWSHAYTGQAGVGEDVEAVGWLERASDGRQRLVVGTGDPVPGELLRTVHLA